MNELDRIVLEGEIVETFDCHRCDGWHPLTGTNVNCCCGDVHDASHCCGCGHFHLHLGRTCPQAPCGDYRCCIN